MVFQITKIIFEIDFRLGCIEPGNNRPLGLSRSVVKRL